MPMTPGTRLAVGALAAVGIGCGGYLAGSMQRSAPAAAAAPAPAAVAAAPPAAATAAASGATALTFPEGSAQLTMLQTQAVEAVPMPVSAEPLSARVAYDEDRTARIAVPLSGRIVRLAVEPGQRVRAGQVLAEIDSPDVGQAVADLDKARSEETRRTAAFERAQALQAGEGIAQRDVEAARADLEQARAETLRAQQRLANLNPRGLPLAGQRVALTSPLDGVVTERNANPGLEVAPGMAAPLFVVTDPSSRWLMVDLPDALAASVRPGSPLAVESDARPGARATARVAQVGQMVDPNSRRVTLRAALANPDGRFLPEMFVRAWLLQATGTAVPVPMSAVVDRGVHPYVFVQTAPRTFERRELRLASRGSQVAYATSGLADGEVIVTAGALLLDAELADQQGGKP